MKAKLSIVIQSMDILKGIPYYLLDGNDIISRDVNAETQPIEQAQGILSEYAHIYGYGNLNFIRVNWYTQKDTLYIIYSVIIPKETELIKGKWYELEEINELDNHLVQRILYESSTTR
jgi:hypothetical protein